MAQLPGWLRPVAYVTPLWHGVELCRGLSLGTASLASAVVHVGYLLTPAGAGFGAAHLTYLRRLHE